MAPDDEQPDPKVKELSAADLERWFGLPSYQQVDEGEVKLPEEDPDLVAVRERRAKAIEAVDPAMVEAHRRRTDGPLDHLLTFKPTITLRLKEDVSVIDMAMIESKLQITEVREVQRPEDIEEQLEDNAPQALLRDLHRPELEFAKLFEIVDMAAEQKIDVVAEVAAAMATSWKLPAFGARPPVEAIELWNEVRAERKKPWPDILNRANLPNRRVTE